MKTFIQELGESVLLSAGVVFVSFGVSAEYPAGVGVGAFMISLYVVLSRKKG